MTLLDTLTAFNGRYFLLELTSIEEDAPREGEPVSVNWQISSDPVLMPNGFSANFFSYESIKGILKAVASLSAKTILKSILQNVRDGQRRIRCI
jgi:hypothetical protein